MQSTLIGQFTFSGGPVLKSVEYLAVGITAMFWTLSTTTILKFCLPTQFCFLVSHKTGLEPAGFHGSYKSGYVEARVNQPPWLHQLAVLSTGWAGWFASFSFTYLPYVNQHSTTVNLFWLLTFDHLFSIPIFFQPWPAYYPPT
jgi:hypothetical protein